MSFSSAGFYKEFITYNIYVCKNEEWSIALANIV